MDSQQTVADLYSAWFNSLWPMIIVIIWICIIFIILKKIVWIIKINIVSEQEQEEEAVNIWEYHWKSVYKSDLK